MNTFRRSCILLYIYSLTEQNIVFLLVHISFLSIFDLFLSYLPIDSLTHIHITLLMQSNFDTNPVRVAQTNLSYRYFSAKFFDYCVLDICWIFQSKILYLSFSSIFLCSPFFTKKFQISPKKPFFDIKL